MKNHDTTCATRGYEVRFGPLPRLEQLRGAWLELESRSSCSFFLSWQWIGTWLELICPARIARLLSVHESGRLVAMGVLTRRSRFFGLGPVSLRLHETGSRELDNLTIEYNGLLCETGHEREALAAMIEYLAEHEPSWLTLFVPGVDVDDIPFTNIRKLPVNLRLHTRATPHVDLDALRESSQPYLSGLSSKTRSAVRRTSRRLAETFGNVTLTIAQTPRQRMVFFRALVDLHQTYWLGKSGRHGAFGDPRIIHFHERLISESGDASGAQLMQLCAGSRPIAYAYNIVSRGVVYFYQSGIDYKAGAIRGSPGLLLLAHAVQHASDAGMRRFEFMAGDAAYKRTLGAAEGKMAWISIDRTGAAARLRRIWWMLKRGGS